MMRAAGGIKGAILGGAAGLGAGAAYKALKD